MATEQLRQPTHPETEPCKADRIRAESTLSRRSTTLRPGIRTRHVYSDARDARYHADARFVVPGSAHALEVRRRDAGRFLTTVLMTDIVDSTHIAARLGDWRWRAHLIEHYADCRALIADSGESSSARPATASSQRSMPPRAPSAPRSRFRWRRDGSASACAPESTPANASASAMTWPESPCTSPNGSAPSPEPTRS